MKYERTTPLLTAHGLGITYDRPILADVNFVIRDLVMPGRVTGQVVSIIGRSGIGKSQLLRCLAGLMKPHAGYVHIGTGQRPVEAGDVGLVPQNYVLLRHRTVLQNLRIAWRAGRSAHHERVHVLADLFGLTPHLAKYPHELSGGQRQRVSILQQVLAGNQTILMDEPFSGLDAPMIATVLNLLYSVAHLDEHQTLVLVSHDIESALAISDTAFLLRPVEGHPYASITHHYDLLELGLSYRPGIQEEHAFRDLIRTIKPLI